VCLAGVAKAQHVETKRRVLVLCTGNPARSAAKPLRRADAEIFTTGEVYWYYMENLQVITAGYVCRRSKTDNLIKVFNENSYVMAEYNDNSGTLVWHRVVLASQKTVIENWLLSHYPARKNGKRPRVA
jgi:hypothetical protein